MSVVNDTQFNIIIYLPKALFITFDDFCQQLDSTLNMYQQHVVPNECWCTSSK